MKTLLLTTLGLLCSFSFLTAQAPANDTCAMSQGITVATLTSNTYTANMVDATETAEGSCQNPSDVDPDVWYNFTMPVDGNVQISDISNNDYITVYESCGGTEVACFFNNSFIYGLTGGDNYTLKFARFGAPNGTYNFTIQAFEAPNNDTCAMSQAITVSTAMTNTYVTNVAGATETVEGTCQNPSDVDPDVWYNFTMPVTGNVQITNISNNDYITVYESCGGAEVACFFNNNFIYGLTGGENYTLKFARFGVPDSVNDFTIQAFAATANDTCAMSQNIPVTSTATTYTANINGATETVEGSCQVANDVDPDVWYNFTMPLNGNIEITNISNNDYITVYDSCGGAEISCFFGNGNILNLTNGQNYLLKFARYRAQGGTYDFDIQTSAAVANNDCGAPEVVSFTVNGDGNSEATLMSRLATATDSGIDSTCDGSGADVDVWYEFTMPVTGNAYFSGLFVYDKITLYSACDEATEVDCRTNNGFVYSLTAGTTYLLRHSIRSQSAADKTLGIETFEVPDNDDCGDAETITFMVNGDGNNEALVTSKLDGATTSAIAGTCDSGSDVNVDVWYEFTMPVTGNIYFSGLFIYDKITLYSACDEATEVVCRTNNGFVYSLTTGTTYLLRHSIRGQNGDEKALGLEVFEEIANDECSNPEDIVFMPNGDGDPEAMLTSKLANATESTITGTCDTTSTTNLDVYYEFEMPVQGNLSISGLFIYDKMTLYSACDTATEVACFTNNGVFENLTIGETYLLRHSIREANGDDRPFTMTAFATIVNDECADRLPLIVTTTEQLTVVTDLRSATASSDPNLPNPCGANASHIYVDAWYEFEMPVDGNLVITNNDSASEAITLFNMCGDIVDVGCEFGSGTIYDLTGGATYVMRYSDRDISLNANSDFRLQAFATIANDECAMRETLVIPTTDQLTVVSELRGATASTTAGLENPCGANSNHLYVDAWYEFTMPVTGNLVITNSDSGSEALTLYDMCGSIVELECEFGSGLFYNLPMGTTYVMRYSDRDISVNDNSDFRLQAFATLDNDDCTDKETLTITTTEELTVTTDLRAASPTVGLPNPCGANASHVYVDAWYEFTMPVNGNLRILNNDSGSEAITLYDTCGDTIDVGCEFGSGLIYNLDQGAVYLLRYSDRDISLNDNSDFRIQAFETAPNDECENATSLNLSTVNAVSVTTDLRGASNDSEISCENNVSRIYLDVWYDMTMPVDGEIQVNNVSNSMFIAFFDACSGNEITCFFNDGSLFNVEAGTNLKMRASVRDIAVGEYTFDVVAVASPLPTCTSTTEFIGNAWTNGIPDSSTNVIIRDDYNSASIDPATSMPYGSIEACSVSVDSGRDLVIAANDYLDVTYNITNNGTIIVDHQGSIVQRDDAAVTTNNGTINVDVTTPNINPRSFMIMGSPMSTETREGALVNAFRVFAHDTNNFVPDPTVAAAFPMAENFADDNGDNWAAHTGLLNPAEGYLVYPQPDLQSGGIYDITFENGTLNNGVVTMPLLFNTDKNSSPNGLSNPYASAILADDFISLNPEIDEVYFWEHLTEPSASLPGYNSANFSMEDISMYNLMGGVKAASDPSESDTKPNGLISTAQGFGVKANAAGTATFNNTMRRLNGNTTLRSSINTDRIWLNITNEQWDIHGSALIGFSESASEMLDQGYDSRRLATFLGIYSHLQDGTEELGIQSRGAFENTMTIPLGFTSQLEQDNAIYTISIGDIEGSAIENVQVYLVDNATGITTNLSQEGYSFNSSMGAYNNRFTLQFVEEGILNTDDISADSFVVYPNPAQDIINIISANAIEISEVHIYDLQGRKLISEILTTSTSQLSIDISRLSSAGYLMTIASENGMITKNIIKD